MVAYNTRVADIIYIIYNIWSNLLFRIFSIPSCSTSLGSFIIGYCSLRCFRSPRGSKKSTIHRSYLSKSIDGSIEYFFETWWKKRRSRPYRRNGYYSGGWLFGKTDKLTSVHNYFIFFFFFSDHSLLNIPL